MYLKRLDLNGFKSFADATSFEFEPGLTAIVGPNGCGKSNISDAIRWVLGEQSAKALRGSSMQDVIFNGTDQKKPQGMAEVSLTFAGCGCILELEYDEVTVTRRVLRSGEGQYFINRTPCRLKDIQRLFMDTGIGTNAYSVLEQGRVDRILSSRPEDRREVFEEASGITRYKADKKEAIRKLEHTEANLLRLDDIIREVKRQIISLQRQAGKAKRYKKLRAELRELDIFVTSRRLTEIDRHINELNTQLAAVREKEDAARKELKQQEDRVQAIREELVAVDRDIAAAMDERMAARSDLERAEYTCTTNAERINELRSLSERESREEHQARERVASRRRELQELDEHRASAESSLAEAEQALKKAEEQLNQADLNLEQKRARAQKLRSDALDAEGRMSGLQNELADLEARQRTDVIRRERLAAEQNELKRGVEAFARRENDINLRLESLRRKEQQAAEQLESSANRERDSRQRIDEQQKLIAGLERRLAGQQAQLELYSEEDADDPFPSGARELLKAAQNGSDDNGDIIGALAEEIEAQPGYGTALEAVLRSWQDAIVVNNVDAVRRRLLDLHSRRSGSVRLLPLHAGEGQTPPDLAADQEPLLPHVRVSERFSPLARRMLAQTVVVEDARSLPTEPSPGLTFVSRDGVILRADGTGEIWAPPGDESQPLVRRHRAAECRRLCTTTTEEIDAARSRLSQLREEHEQTLSESAELRRICEQAQRETTLCEGEQQVVAGEAVQARERAETVAWELQSLTEQDGSGDERRKEIDDEIERIRRRQGAIRGELEQIAQTIEECERQYAGCQTVLTERRVEAAEKRHRRTHLDDQRQPLVEQINELEALIEQRSQGASGYHERIAALRKAAEEAAAGIEPLQARIADCDQRLCAAREERRKRDEIVTQSAQILQDQRETSELLRRQTSKLEVEIAERRVKRQNIVERVTGEHHLAEHQVFDCEEPDWGDDPSPALESMETRIAEVRAKLESMGPVNLVAIDEHRELQERYDFLIKQRDDLLQAKQQLLELIGRINSTTTEMFADTFNQVNDSFQEMFKKLFGGGSAKLVMVDEEDVLESGIEIIARPPGKKLQSVSLLSGGERTLTAVALLFALYLVKPSPFCVLDELDAALDDSNIQRFVEAVQEFIEKSQFIVITHNQRTIRAAEVLYGVTMEKAGVSRIVSVRLNDHENREEAAAAMANS